MASILHTFSTLLLLIPRSQGQSKGGMQAWAALRQRKGRPKECVMNVIQGGVLFHFLWEYQNLMLGPHGRLASQNDGVRARKAKGLFIEWI